MHFSDGLSGSQVALAASGGGWNSQHQRIVYFLYSFGAAEVTAASFIAVGQLSNGAPKQAPSHFASCSWRAGALSGADPGPIPRAG